MREPEQGRRGPASVNNASTAATTASAPADHATITSVLSSMYLQDPYPLAAISQDSVLSNMLYVLLSPHQTAYPPHAHLLTPVSLAAIQSLHSTYDPPQMILQKSHCIGRLLRIMLATVAQPSGSDGSRAVRDQLASAVQHLERLVVTQTDRVVRSVSFRYICMH